MPDFDINGYTGQFKGGARQNLFYFKPMFPGVIGAVETNKKAKFLVRSTSVPESTLEEVTTSWQGFDYKMAGKHTFAPFTVSFNVDLKADIRQAFERWVSLIHDQETNFYALPAEYMEDQYLQMLDYSGGIMLEFKLVSAFPTSVAAITLDYATVDVAQFDVTFAYQYHTMQTTGTAA